MVAMVVVVVTGLVGELGAGREAQRRTHLCGGLRIVPRCSSPFRFFFVNTSDTKGACYLRGKSDFLNSFTLNITPDKRK